MYYCLWDDHNQPVSTPDEYFRLTRGHITELVTQYKGLVEIWIDIPSRLTESQRTELYNIVKLHQPDCLVTCNNGFTDGSVLLNFPADITNGERTLPPVKGHNPVMKINGKEYYIPMEVCQTINQNWFWLPGDVTKSVRTLYYWYSESIKRGANLLLDVPPDLTGQIPADLVKRLMELKEVIDNPDKLMPLKTLTGYKPVEASSLFKGRVEYLPEYAVDEDPNTRWLASLSDSLPTLTVDLGAVKQFNSVILMEPYNAHVEAFEVQYLQGQEWKSLFKGTTIGSELTKKFRAVESRMVRLVIKKYKTGENPFNVLSFPGLPPPVEGATISELQVYDSAEDDPDYMSSFQEGREYFFLRSGKAKLIIQADKSGILPAFTYMLFDAGNPSQSAKKVNAINYIPGTNFEHTALKVILGNIGFYALGHNSTARWTTRNNIPAVELSWWAGGIRIVETFSPDEKSAGFNRMISLTNSDLAGNDSIRISCQEGYPESDLMPIKKGQTISVLMNVPIPSSLSGDVSVSSGSHKLSSISTSDSLIFTLYRNASFALPGMVAANGRMDAGVFEYGNQWVRDGSNVARGLICSGAFESARALLDYILSDLVSEEGITIIAGGIDEPDREQYDQMGVLMNSLKLYSDWTGDNSLLTTYSKKILTLIERPLNPAFRDNSGMVHNRREFWERTFSDAYELAYQTYMVQGLRDAASLSGILGVPEKADYWRKEADVFLNAMLHHPTLALVYNGAFIKRRNVTGEIADITYGRQKAYMPDAPVETEFSHLLNPDATYALPVIFKLVDPKSDLAKKSLDKLESIWNSRWYGGGYERYHSSSQLDQPGPWTFGTAYIARAQHDAGLLERSRRSLQWLNDVQGGNAGAWFEEIPLTRSQIPTSGIVPWTSAEVTSFVMLHWLGMSVDGDYIIFKPNLYPGTSDILADIRFRSVRLNVSLLSEKGKILLKLNGKTYTPDKNRAYKILIKSIL